MKKSKSKFIVSLILSLLALIVPIVLFVLVITTESLSIADLFQNGKAIAQFFSCFNFQKTDLPILLAVIAFIVVAALWVIVLIGITVKKNKVLFLISDFLFLLGGFAGALALFQVVGTLGISSILFLILGYASVGLSVIAGLITLIFVLSGEKKEKEEAIEKPRVESVSVSAAPAPTPAPAEEKQAPIEYVEPNAPLNYAEEDILDEPLDPLPPVKPAPSSDSKAQKILGKYEIFPEAGFFKYRLKANNGEILLVSHGYKTREGVRYGIATLQRNVPNGVSKIITDKNGFSQFRIFTQNDSRLIVAGEFYSSSASAQKALNSVQRFYMTERIVDLNEIPENEIREWKVDLPPMNPTKNGKFEVYIEEESKKWQGRLVANNGAVLFVTSTYSSKNAVLNAFENIKSKALAGDLDIAKDKQNRYHFRIISENGSVILMGETYPSRESAISAAVSVRNFIGDAKMVYLSR